MKKQKTKIKKDKNEKILKKFIKTIAKYKKLY